MAPRLRAAEFAAHWETGSAGERYLCWPAEAWHLYTVQITNDLANYSTVGSYYAGRTGDVRWHALTINPPPGVPPAPPPGPARASRQFSLRHTNVGWQAVWTGAGGIEFVRSVPEASMPVNRFSIGFHTTATHFVSLACMEGTSFIVEPLTPTPTPYSLDVAADYTALLQSLQSIDQTVPPPQTQGAPTSVSGTSRALVSDDTTSTAWAKTKF